MKLIFCPKCQDLVRLFLYKRSCSCGACWGYYIDEINAVYSKGAVPIGLLNGMFERIVSKWLSGVYDQDVSGIRFEAFVIPPTSVSFTEVRDEAPSP